jgi:hypothetical protein
LNRREAVQNILIASAGTVLLTGCAESNVIEFLANNKLTLNGRHKRYLDKISETFLPVSDISKKIGKPSEFILTMLNDLQKSEEVEQFAIGFDQYKLLMETSQLKIKSSDPKEILVVVESTLEASTPQKELVFFINTTKDLSTWHCVSSEYYTTEYLAYKLITGTFQGCATV